MDKVCIRSGLAGLQGKKANSMQRLEICVHCFVIQTILSVRLKWDFKKKIIWGVLYIHFILNLDLKYDFYNSECLRGFMFCLATNVQVGLYSLMKKSKNQDLDPMAYPFWTLWGKVDR